MNLLLLFFLVRFSGVPGVDHFALIFNPEDHTPPKKNHSEFNLAERLRRFEPLNSLAGYSITICADIPDNSNAKRVHVGQKPGHVFIILEKIDSASGESVVQVFGFYPLRERSSIFSGDVSPKLSDNSNREYNVSLSMELSAVEFQHLLSQSQKLAGRKYNLRNFNCYDYVIEVFNSVPGIEKLPVTHVRLPYFLGRAGSPCGLYRDLMQIKTVNSHWAENIRFGTFIAPASTVK